VQYTLSLRIIIDDQWVFGVKDILLENFPNKTANNKNQNHSNNSKKHSVPILGANISGPNQMQIDFL